MHMYTYVYIVGTYICIYMYMEAVWGSSDPGLMDFGAFSGAPVSYVPTYLPPQTLQARLLFTAICSHSLLAEVDSTKLNDLFWELKLYMKANCAWDDP